MNQGDGCKTLQLYQLGSAATLRRIRSGTCCAVSAVAGAELLSFVYTLPSQVRFELRLPKRLIDGSLPCGKHIVPAQHAQLVRVKTHQAAPKSMCSWWGSHSWQAGDPDDTGLPHSLGW